MLVKPKSVGDKDFFNKKEESPTKINGLDENLLEILVLNQCEPSKI